MLELGVLSGYLTHVLCILLVGLFVAVLARRLRFVWALREIPGPWALPLIGNALQFTGPQEDFFRLMQDYSKRYGGIFCVWIGLRPFAMLSRAETVEPLLKSWVHLDKSYEYTFLKDWVGTGLLTGSGNKWRTRRKMLTPCFHNIILGDFLTPIYEESQVMAENLNREVGKDRFNIIHYTKLCALDIICDTAMGTKIRAQQGSHEDYVSSIDSLSGIVQRRFITPWLKPDWLFKRSALGKLHERCVDITQSVTHKIIKDRRQQWRKQKKNLGLNDKKDDTCNNNRRLAFLDQLLEHSEVGGKYTLTDDDIQEEVATFMFAGHDTTAISLGWCLFMFGSHPDVQERVYQEIQENIEDLGKCPTIHELQKLEYLERCIKEVLRLYPAVPLIAREAKEPVKILDQTLPVGTTVLINLYLLHRDSRYFPDPEDFNPDRFLNTSSNDRHPFCYVPFSAGARNCIGQKFAMLELKIVLITLLSRYVFKSVDKKEDLALFGELVLLNKGGLNLCVTRRNV